MKDFLTAVAAVVGVFGTTFLLLKFSPDAIPGLILLIIVLANVILRFDKEEETKK